MLPCNFMSKEADKNKLLNLSETAQNQLWLKLDLKYLVLIRMVSLFHGVSFTLIILLGYRGSTRVTSSLTVDFGKFRLNCSVQMLLTILHGTEINEMFENFCRSSSPVPNVIQPILFRCSKVKVRSELLEWNWSSRWLLYRHGYIWFLNKFEPQSSVIIRL